MPVNEKAVLLMDAILEDVEKLEETILKYYCQGDYSLKEGFEKIARLLERGEVAKDTRDQKIITHPEYFKEVIQDAQLLEQGFVNGHENYEYRWYLHLDENQQKEEHIELFINCVSITTASLDLMIKDYVDRASEEDLLMIDPTVLVSEMASEDYYRLVQQILVDSNQRMQRISRLCGESIS